MIKNKKQIKLIYKTMVKYLLCLSVGYVVYLLSIKYDFLNFFVFGYVGIKIVEWFNKPSDDWWNNVA